MKIGVLTYHSIDNYGSILMALALGRTLRKLGHASEIIDYRTSKVESLYRIFRKPESIGAILRDLYSAAYYLPLKRKREKYEVFRNQQLNLSKDRYTSLTDLAGANSHYDAFISGSDQVWNFTAPEYSEAYFLPFVRDKVKIAYAPSFGGAYHVTSEMLDPVKPYLKEFDYITVREKAGQALVKQALNRDVEIAADPVLLLSAREWESYAAPAHLPKRPYILCYSLGSSTDAQESAKRIQKLSGYEVIHMMPYWKNAFFNGRKRYDAGPEDFLSLVRNASFICSNSFHATVFALVFKKRFLYVNQTQKTDDRIATLLSNVHLSSRYISSVGQITSTLLGEMDWRGVQHRISQLRNKSLQGLKRALEIKKEA